jgi:hypothetical protein
LETVYGSTFSQKSAINTRLCAMSQNKRVGKSVFKVQHQTLLYSTKVFICFSTSRRLLVQDHERTLLQIMATVVSKIRIYLSLFLFI